MLAPMSLWLSDVLSPEAVVRHIALLLVVIALMMPTLALVRWFALASGIVGVILSTVVSYDPVGLFWWTLLIVVAIVRLVMASDWRIGGRLTKEQELFHRRVVPALSPGQVRLLLTVGRWREVVPSTTLTRAGEQIGELCFITRGQVDIVVDGRKVADCGPGTLIGEIGLSTGDPATATAVCATPVRYLGFDAPRLYHLLDAHPELQNAIELAIERSVREKLHRSNVVAAHQVERGRR
jgi:hypothetical protein